MELEVYQSYEEFDRIFSEKIRETQTHMKTVAGDFVEIGYLLKRARDTDILHASGYRNIYEYAEEKYKVDKSEVSRYIRINDRFSEGGYSGRLREPYQEFGVAKLVLMLSLPDAVNEELTPEFSKADIQAIKEEVQAEQEITDIEVMLEEKDILLEQEDTLLDQVMKKLQHDKPELYLDMMCDWEGEGETIVNQMAPAGIAVFTVRIPGTGRIMMTVSEDSEDIVLTNIRSGGKETFPKSAAAKHMGYRMDKPDAIDFWERSYGEPWPIRDIPKETPAESKEASKTKHKVTKAKVEKPKMEKKDEVAPVQQNPEPEEEAENSIRQQDSQKETSEQTEENGEEVLSGEVEEENEPVTICNRLKEEIPSDEVKPVSDGVNTEHEPDSVRMTEAEFQKRMEEYREAFREELEGAGRSIEGYSFALTKRFLEEATDILNKMDQLDDEYEEYYL